MGWASTEDPQSTRQAASTVHENLLETLDIPENPAVVRLRNEVAMMTIGFVAPTTNTDLKVSASVAAASAGSAAVPEADRRIAPAMLW